MVYSMEIGVYVLSRHIFRTTFKHFSEYLSKLVPVGKPFDGLSISDLVNVSPKWAEEYTKNQENHQAIPDLDYEWAASNILGAPCLMDKSKGVFGWYTSSLKITYYLASRFDYPYRSPYSTFSPPQMAAMTMFKDFKLGNRKSERSESAQ